MSENNKEYLIFFVLLAHLLITNHFINIFSKSVQNNLLLLYAFFRIYGRTFFYAFFGVTQFTKINFPAERFELQSINLRF